MKPTIRIALIAITLLATAVNVIAQTSNDKKVAQAERMMKFFIADEPDSLVSCLPEDVQALVPAEALKGQYTALEQEYGQLKGREAWASQEIKGLPCLVSVMHFEKIDLAAIVPFNGDRPMVLQIVPYSMIAPDEEKRPDGVIETTDTLRSDGVNLPMTICMPLFSRHAPVVVLVHGSGPQDRDETILNVNRPFRDIAWGLAKRGIATVRYDKRTLVKRTYGQPTLDEETVNDALAAVKYVRDKGLASNGKVFVLGHSLGAMAAPRIAEKDGHLSGIILLAAPARPMREVVSDQIDYLLPQANRPLNRDSVINSILQRDLPAFGDYKATLTAASLTIPILVLQGEKDYQVTLRDFQLWKSALAKSPKAEFKLYPKLHHLFIKSDAEGLSSPDDYLKKGHVATYVIDDIAAFVKGH